MHKLRTLTNKTQFGPVRREVFGAFVDWLYNGYAGFGLNDEPTNNHQVDCGTLIELWVFAGRAGVPACQNACIEGIEMWRQNCSTIHTSALAYVFANTTDYDKNDCGLKQLLVDQCAWMIDMEWIESVGEDQFPRVAMVAVIRRIRELLNTGADHRKRPFESLEMRK